MSEMSKTDMYIMANQKYFPGEKMIYLKEKMSTMTDSKWSMLSTVELQDPTTLLLVSIFVGCLGVDRFMLGQVGMGLLKLFTLGGCGFLTIYDWFTISGKTRERNFNKVMMLI